jgi:hypothetical protein
MEAVFWRSTFCAAKNRQAERRECVQLSPIAGPVRKWPPTLKA